VRYAIFSLILILTGCATVPLGDTQTIANFKTRTYDVAYDPCWTATINALESQNFPIEDIDKDNGLIKTGSRSVTIFLFKQRALVHVTKVTDSSTRVKVTLYLDSTEVGNQAEYRTFFAALDKAMP